MVQIVENYKDYKPPTFVRRSIERMLRSVPDKYLAGLGAIVLTNTASFSRKDRRKKLKSRGRKVALRQSLGTYSRAWKGEKAWIELHVDNILETAPRISIVFPFIQDMILGDTLWHEIGHHIHKTQVPEFREREDVADTWLKKLRTEHLRKCYWYLFWPIAFVKHPINVTKVALRGLRGVR